MQYSSLIALLCFLLLCSTLKILAHFCGNNRIPYGVEIHKNGQPVLLCSQPSCFEKLYADCDERAMRKSCDAENQWVGGFDKSPGKYQPLYVQCCEFESLSKISDPLYSNVTIWAGKYFEGEEVMDQFGKEMTAFDIITNIQMVPHTNSTAYLIDIRRMHCNRIKRPKHYKHWKWP